MEPTVFNYPGDLSSANLEDPEQRLFSELLCTVCVATGHKYCSVLIYCSF